MVKVPETVHHPVNLKADRLNDMAGLALRLDPSKGLSPFHEVRA